ncbi:MAG: ATP-binding protein [Roseovarius sp.]|nr:ATP-binding protein [Roseovarius sp.]MCY4206328.1 ATP-binding protein [Roseovarius sp.]MCY4291597.1 ATP-binding protein [Roseovarius sp.]MCY4317092.1 ATP-binding protein [Roseovarius sp.]
MTDTYLPRHLVQELEVALQHTRVVNLIGPRQAGKTTLVRDLFDRGNFISLDDAATLAALEADSYGQIKAMRQVAGDNPLIIDEAQRSTDLSLAIKRIVDEDRSKGQFVLTGSSNVFRTANVADSLAGRMRTLTLWPLSTSEICRAPVSRLIDWAMAKNPEMSAIKTNMASRSEVIDVLLKGGFPEVRQMPLKERQRQYRYNVDAMVDRDVADIFKIRKTDALRRLVNQMAARTANELNISTLSNAVKIRRETTEQYVDILLRLSVVVKLDAWASGEGKREIKNPKYHFVDSGVLCALRHFDEHAFDIGGDPTALGAVLESFVLNELLRAAPMQDSDPRIYHWRSADKREIDILIESGGRLIGVEVKAASTVSARDFRHLRWFGQDGPGCARQFTGLVIYLGSEKLSFGSRMFALPVSSLRAVIS